METNAVDVIYMLSLSVRFSFHNKLKVSYCLNNTFPIYFIYINLVVSPCSSYIIANFRPRNTVYWSRMWSDNSSTVLKVFLSQQPNHQFSIISHRNHILLCWVKVNSPNCWFMASNSVISNPIINYFIKSPTSNCIIVRGWEKQI